MAEDKDLAKQKSESIKEIKSETKTGIGFIKDAVKEGKQEIKQAGKDQLSSIKTTGKEQVEAIKDNAKTTKQEIKDLSANFKKEIKTATTTSKKEIKDGISKIKQTTKDSVTDVKDLAKESKSDINQLAAKVKKEANQASTDIKDQTADAVETVSQHTETQVDSLKETASLISDKNKEDFKEAVEESKEEIKTAFNEGSKETKSTIEKLIEDQKKKVDATSESKKIGGSSADLTTKILQNILSEIKILRKVTEGSVSFDKKSGRYRDAKTGQYKKDSDVKEDATKEEDEKEKKRKGFFSNMKDKFAKVKKKAEPLAEGAKSIGEGAKGLATNPLVLAGLLALLAPKELLDFLKGFLGEVLFGENANVFVQTFGAFVAIWAGFKIYNAVKNIIGIIRGLWSIGRFLFMNPIMLAILAAMVIGFSVWKGIQKRARLKELEDKVSSGKELTKEEKSELAELQGSRAEFTTIPQNAAAAIQIAHYRIQKEKQARGDKYDEDFVKHIESAPGVTSAKNVAEYVGKDAKDLTMEDYILFDQGALGGKDFRTGEAPKKDRIQKKQEIYQDVEKELKKMRGGAEPENKPPVANVTPSTEQANGGTAETKPATNTNIVTQQTQNAGTPEQKAAATGTTSMAPQGAQTAGEEPSGKINIPTPKASNEGAAPSTPSSPSSESIEPEKKKEDEIPSLEAPQPSIGANINDTSQAVEAGYDDNVAEDTVTQMTSDTTSIPKPSNTTEGIPSILADRSSFIQYELFYTQSMFPTTNG